MQLYAGVIPVDESGRVALQQREHKLGLENAGLLTAFGGLAEGTEDAEQAALRELGEELALYVARAELHPLLECEKSAAGSLQTWCAIFRVRVPDVGTLRTSEGIGVVFGTPGELLARSDLSGVCRRAVKAVAVPQ
jgi:8-oxo-dGTP pyrophosphatase MutT (NUDIX family)